MPYKDSRLRKNYQRDTYLRKKKKLLRKCPICNIRDFSFGNSCKNCARISGNGGINWARKIALERDNFTCQICGINEVELVEVDHILPVKDRPDLYAEPSNLMVLCPNCHKRKTINDRKK